MIQISEYSPRAILGLESPALMEDIVDHLENEGIQVECSSELSIVMAKSTHFFYELIVLEIGSRTLKSFPIRVIRKKNPSALLIILCRDTKPAMKISLLEQGADMMIDISSELESAMMQLKCIMKKLMPRERKLMRFDSLVIDRSSQSAMINKRKIMLRKREFLLLSYLVNHANTVVSRNQIMKKIWGDKTVKENTIDSQINRLRCRLGEKTGKIIKTIYTKGYSLQRSVC